MLSVVVSTMMMADDVTPEVALQQATQFSENRVARGNGPRLAPGVQPKLTLASRVSDLYVFNVGSDAGFIIVSNDDCAVPILGYSDSGSFDANNIPDNMRAWLQGYADEIAWAKANHVKTAANAPALAPQYTGTAVKSPIAPLVQTKWNQNEPYNNLCPKYNSKKSYTGCVATAMAQCMYFTEMRAGSTTTYTTEQILGYNTETRGLEVDAVAANTPIYWSKMRNTYTASDTDEGAAAVAELMLYCGTSVQMDYYVDNQGSSGAQTHSVATALKSYFGYNTTTTYVQRSFYTYANWIELMYNELKLHRVICYGGQSSGGGHEFVIDGYQSEDFFHVNWGWGGNSDNYFKLSALDSDEQGIGGSSSTDGYHYGQDAVIGIQKSTEDLGAIANVPVNTVNLALNSVSFSENPTQYQEVTVTIDLRNNSDDVYDGDIGIRIQYKNGSDWVYVADVASDFLIPANTNSKIIQLKFTPEHSGTYGLSVYRPSESAGYINFITNVTYNVDVVAGSELSGSNNVELSITRQSVDNTVEYGTYGTKTAYSLYGNDFKGIIRLTNNTENDYSGVFLWQLVPSSGLSDGIVLEDVSIFVPKNSHIDIDIKRTNIDMNEIYLLVMTYVYNNSYSIDSDNIESAYVPKPAILSYLANGTKEIIIPAGTSYDAATNAPTALSIDVTGTGITDITPNSNPNTLYISDVALSGLVDRNIVTKNAGNYSAESITLTDGSPFYSPVDFTATNIEFTYNNTKQADGTNGWNSLVLPFDVTSVTANGEAIDWFHSGTDSGKHFWVKQFVSDESNQVYFDYADEMKANTPYIIALPGDAWGAKWDLSAKTIKFIGENVVVSNGGTISSVTGSNYRFIGKTVQDNTANIYCLNDGGSAFVLKETGGSAPFRAYFKPGIFDASVTNLGIGSWTGGTTSINEPSININNEAPATWYSIDGRRLTTKPTQKGIYIQNGKKVVIK